MVRRREKDGVYACVCVGDGRGEGVGGVCVCLCLCCVNRRVDANECD